MNEIEYWVVNMKESEKDIYSWYNNVENFEVNDLLENTIHEEALTNE